MPAVHLADDVLRRIARARERMHDESDRVLRVSELARQACPSEQHFVRMFRAAYGCTPGQYLGKLRIAEAKRLLAQGTCGDQEWKAELEHPQQSGYVSLRGEVSDGLGTSSKVTIIRAYWLE